MTWQQECGLFILIILALNEIREMLLKAHLHGKIKWNTYDQYATMFIWTTCGLALYIMMRLTVVILT